MLVVQKFGGSSLADTSRIRRAAARIATLRQQGHQVVAVVSAQGDTTGHVNSACSATYSVHDSHVISS